MTRPNKGSYPTVPVVVRGQHFPSIAATARHFGITSQSVHSCLENGRPDSIGTRGSYGPRLPFTIAGRQFKSKRGLARLLGYSQSGLSYRLSNDHGYALIESLVGKLPLES